MNEKTWQTDKFICVARATMWDLEKIGALNAAVSMEEVQEIIAKRLWNIAKDGLESMGVFPVGSLPPYADVPHYKEELAQFFAKRDAAMHRKNTL
jgi:hypothetical protein